MVGWFLSAQRVGEVRKGKALCGAESKFMRSNKMLTTENCKCVEIANYLS